MSESRSELLLDSLINNDDEEAIVPQSRAEQYLKACCQRCGCDNLPEPQSRGEQLLYDLAEEIHEAQADLQTATITPTESQQVVRPDIDYEGFSQVIVEAIPADHIVPTGYIELNENGSVDVTEYATAIVNAPILDTSDATATENDLLNGEIAYVNGERVVGAIQAYDNSLTGGSLAGTLAITENGTYDVSTYTTANVNVSEEETIKFYDYDGTLVCEWPISELQSKTELPSAPIHDGLIFIEWNWTLEDLKYQNTEVAVGPCYDVESGLAEFDVALTSITGLTVSFGSGNAISFTEVDWGDGAINVERSHTYENYGEYTIKCNLDRNNVSYYVFGQNSSNHNYYLKNIRLPSRCNVLSYSFAYCKNLETALFKRNGDLSQYAYSNCSNLKFAMIGSGNSGQSSFDGCSYLKAVSISKSVSSISSANFSSFMPFIKCMFAPINLANKAVYCKSGSQCIKSIVISRGATSLVESFASNLLYLEHVFIPSTVVAIPNYAFYACRKLDNVDIHNVSDIGISAFYSCYSLTNIKFSNNLQNIQAGCFAECVSMREYDFSQSVVIPTLVNVSAFNGINISCKIKVPTALYDQWIAATNWSAYASYIVAV